jgi:hypothetical protein
MQWYLLASCISCLWYRSSKKQPLEVQKAPIHHHRTKALTHIFDSSEGSTRADCFHSSFYFYDLHWHCCAQIRRPSYICWFCDDMDSAELARQTVWCVPHSSFRITTTWHCLQEIFYHERLECMSLYQVHKTGIITNAQSSDVK